MARRDGEGMFYPRRCYKLFRIVKNSRWTGDSAGRTYGIFHYGSLLLPFSSRQRRGGAEGWGGGGGEDLPVSCKNFNARKLHLAHYIRGGFENHRRMTRWTN